MREKRRLAIRAAYAAYKAGSYLTESFGKTTSVREKSELDFVSEADKKAEEIIVSEILSAFPDDAVLSEESDEATGKTGYRWIIDPLDGTHNFLAGFKEFGVLLALEEKGEVALGICYFPMLDEFFFAEKNKGAWLNGKRIRVSCTAEFRGQMFFSDGTLRYKPREILNDIKKFCRIGCRLRVFGSTPYAFTRVALGQALISTNRFGKPWDIAAPALLVEEAGGKVTDEKGNPWRIDSENLIATNGLVHSQALFLYRSPAST